MKRQLVSVFAMSMGLALLGCGGKKSKSEDSSTPETPAEPTASPEPEEDPTAITVSGTLALDGLSLTSSPQKIDIYIVTFEPKDPQSCYIGVDLTSGVFEGECKGLANKSFGVFLLIDDQEPIAIVVDGRKSLMAGAGSLVFTVSKGENGWIAVIDLEKSDAMAAEKLGDKTEIGDLTGSWAVYYNPTPEDIEDGMYYNAQYFRHDVAAGKLDIWNDETEYSACHDDDGEVALKFQVGSSAAVDLLGQLDDFDGYLAAIEGQIAVAASMNVSDVRSELEAAIAVADAQYEITRSADELKQEVLYHYQSLIREAQWRKDYMPEDGLCAELGMYSDPNDAQFIWLCSADGTMKDHVDDALAAIVEGAAGSCLPNVWAMQSYDEETWEPNGSTLLCGDSSTGECFEDGNYAGGFSGLMYKGLDVVADYAGFWSAYIEETYESVKYDAEGNESPCSIYYSMGFNNVWEDDTHAAYYSRPYFKNEDGCYQDYKPEYPEEWAADPDAPAEAPIPDEPSMGLTQDVPVASDGSTEGEVAYEPKEGEAEAGEAVDSYYEEILYYQKL